MSTHLIRTDLLPNLKRTIAPIARKCVKKNIPYDYQEVGKEYKEIDFDGNKKYIEFTQIELNINPCINGWTVIVQIERTDTGHNLITRCNVPYSKEYDKYINNDIHCEHCKQNRRRKTAYILKNDETNETIIVGSTCLEEFTGGLDASIVAQCFESLKYIELSESNGGNYENVSNEIISYNSEYILNIAFAVMKKNGGYIKNSSSNSTTLGVKEFLDGNNTVIEGNILDNADISKEYIEWTRNYLNDKEELNSYERNLKTVLQNNRVCWSELAILCSLIPVYQRNHQTESEQKINEYFGELKQRVTIKIKEVTSHSFDSYYGTFFIHVFTSEEGYTFVWKTNKSISRRHYIYLKNNDEIKAYEFPTKIIGTISGYNEYRGVKQTELKRCDILAIEMRDVNNDNIIDEKSDNIDYIN